MNNDLIGTIRRNELRDILTALVLARPDYRDAITMVAVATGLIENVSVERNNHQLLSQADGAKTINSRSGNAGPRVR